MQNVNLTLSQGLYADVQNDWLIHVVEGDPRNAGVFYIGSYPYDGDARPLHPDAPEVTDVWDRWAPGARQISERQKRYAHYKSSTLVDPIFELLHA